MHIMKEHRYLYHNSLVLNKFELVWLAMIFLALSVIDLIAELTYAMVVMRPTQILNTHSTPSFGTAIAFMIVEYSRLKRSQAKKLCVVASCSKVACYRHFQSLNISYQSGGHPSYQTL